MTKNAGKFAGDFDCHKDAAVRCRAHCPMEHIQRFTQSHWMLPLGKKCLHRVAPVTATVIEISGKHKKYYQDTTFRVSNYVTYHSLVFYENFIPQNGPSTQLIDATSRIKV